MEAVLQPGSDSREFDMSRLNKTDTSKFSRAIGIAVFFVGLLAFWFAFHFRAIQRQTTVIQIDTARTGYSIPRSFLGLSFEWGAARPFMGIPSTGINPIFRQLIANLLENNDGPVMVRIGGDSTDLLPSNGKPDPVELSGYVQLHHDIGANFFLSTNLGSGDPKLAATQAQFFAKTMPADSLKAVEIGNEPDQFASKGRRPQPYTFADYLRDFSLWQSTMKPVLPPGLKVMGPSWASPASLDDLPKFLKEEGDNLAVVSQHWYAGVACGNKPIATDYLLESGASDSGAKIVASSVGLAHSKGLPFRIGEMNSIACDGRVGVTDTFASALWVVDALFEMASVGVDGVHIHMDTDDNYGPFLFTVDTSVTPHRYSIKTIRPEYYGMLLFQRAAPAGAKLVHANLNTPSNVKTWATLDDHRVLRVTLINKDKKSARRIVLRASGYGAATLERLIAPSFDAKTGVTLDGMTFDGSQDGKPLGAPNTESVAPSKGAYEVQLPAASAALLTLKLS
jgi:Glycosyl hydrolase family 79 C-terminal beta domain